MWPCLHFSLDLICTGFFFAQRGYSILWHGLHHLHLRWKHIKSTVSRTTKPASLIPIFNAYIMYIFATKKKISSPPPPYTQLFTDLTSLYMNHLASRVTYQNISPEVTRKPWRVMSPDSEGRGWQCGDMWYMLCGILK